MTRLIPSLAGWGSFPRATVNFLISALVISSTLWSVHQVEYLIVYRQRFAAVMATGPHSLYMGQLGLGLLVVFGIAAVLRAGLLGHADSMQRRIARRLPDRWRRALPAHVPAIQLPVRALLATTALFAAVQIGLYTIQENLESGLSMGLWPGLSVLWGVHITAVPLHVLGALCGASILWVASLLLQRSRSTLRLARALALFAAPPIESTSAPAANCGWVPVARLDTRVRGARAPPFAA